MSKSNCQAQPAGPDSPPLQLSRTSTVATQATTDSETLEIARINPCSQSCTRDFADLNDEDRLAIFWKSVRLAQLSPFTRSDADDISQELALVWARSRLRYDPEQGTLQAFRATVLERTAAKLLRHARATKRFAVPTKSLDAGDNQLATLDVGHDRRREHTRSMRTPQQLVDLRLDVQHVLSSLPPHLSELCELLKEHTVAEISRDLGIPASTVSSRVSLIRKRFESSKFRSLL